MERIGWQRTWVRLLTTTLTLLMMVMIFFFSAENGEQSNQTSGLIAEQVIPIIAPDYEQLPETQQRGIYDRIQLFVRKCAHFTEYMILGAMIRCCLESWFGHVRKGKTISLFSGTVGALYAGTDEAHQLLVDGRGGQLFDVALDSCGVVTGVILIAVILGHRKKRKLQEGP